MSTEGSVTRWIAELDESRADEAQQELWRRYFHRLAGFAQRKLGAISRAVADEEDVAAEALNSFFGGAADGRFSKLKDRHDLWPLLAKLAARKSVDQQRRILAEKRGGGAVRGDSAIAGSAESYADWPAALLDEEIRPDSLVAISEECDRLLALLPDEQLRLIARRRLEGYANAEIARELGVMERTVERRLQLIRSLWSEDLGEVAPG